jgi:hypothetical protein
MSRGRERLADALLKHSTLGRKHLDLSLPGLTRQSIIFERR